MAHHLIWIVFLKDFLITDDMDFSVQEWYFEGLSKRALWWDNLHLFVCINTSARKLIFCATMSTSFPFKSNLKVSEPGLSEGS